MQVLKCSVKGCEKPSYVRKLCSAHYARWYKSDNFELAKRKVGAINPNGYKVFGFNGKHEYEHRLIAARALGRPLPLGVEVHHFDNDGLNNVGPNLVICPNAAYHKLLHYRQRALEACGNADWMKCGFCKKYDVTTNLNFVATRPYMVRHSKCSAFYQRNRLKKIRLQTEKLKVL